MFEEVSTLAVAVAIAGALLAVGAVLFAYFNPQQPVDHANAAFFPLVRPLNETHVQLGVKPLADYVEVVEVMWSRNGTRGHAPVRLVARNAAWLLHNGKPVAVTCGANVTVATRYGAASRALNFHVACVEREKGVLVDLTGVKAALEAYAEFLLKYYAMANTPVISAYYSIETYDMGSPGRVAYMRVRVKNIWREPLVLFAVEGRSEEERRLLRGDLLPYPDYAPGRGLPMPILLRPGEEATLRLGGWPLEDAWILGRPMAGVPGRFNDHGFFRWIYLDAFVGSLELWANGVLAYNGTETPRAVKTPQGYLVNVTSNAVEMCVTDSASRRERCYRVQPLPAFRPGYNHWSGWVRFDIPFINRPTTSLDRAWWLLVFPAAELRAAGFNYSRTVQVSGDVVTVTTELRNASRSLGWGFALPYVFYALHVKPEDGALHIRWLPTDAPSAEDRYVRSAVIAGRGAYVASMPGPSRYVMLYADEDLWLAYGGGYVWGTRLDPRMLKCEGYYIFYPWKYTVRCDFNATLDSVEMRDTGQRRDGKWLLDVYMHTLNGKKHVGQVWAPTCRYFCDRERARFEFDIADGGRGICHAWVKEVSYGVYKPQWECGRGGRYGVLEAEERGGDLIIRRDGREAAVVRGWRGIPPQMHLVVQYKPVAEMPTDNPIAVHHLYNATRAAYRGSEEAAVPYAVRPDLRGALAYRLETSGVLMDDYHGSQWVGALVEAQANVPGGTKVVFITPHNASSVEVLRVLEEYYRDTWSQTLRLFYAGQLSGPGFAPFDSLLPPRGRWKQTAYDAIYAVTYRIVVTPPYMGSGGEAAPRPDDRCIPREEVGNPLRSFPANLRVRGSVASYDIMAEVPVRIYGCGQETRTTRPVYVTTITTDAGGIGITDDQGYTCTGLGSIVTCGDRLRCYSCNKR